MTYENAICSIKDYLSKISHRSGTVLEKENCEEDKCTFHRYLRTGSFDHILYIHAQRETDILRFRVFYDDKTNNKITLTPEAGVIFQYLTTANNEYAEELCHAGIDEENEPYIEIRHNYKMFDISAENLAEFERICTERIREDHFVVYSLLFEKNS